MFAIQANLESVIADGDVSLSSAFSRWRWIANILTLDSPADIRRYRLPKVFFQETQVRELMALRADFSREAVFRVKIELT